jgi:hypothetical protein
MSRIVKISNGDYKVVVGSGVTPANITLDTVGQSGTPASYGTVTIKGNLDVVGTTTTIESVNSYVQDAIFELNYNPNYVGSGIASTPNNYKSGIQINRGILSAAQFIFDESVTHYDPATGLSAPGSFVARTADGVLTSVQLAAVGTQAGFDINFDLNNSGNVLNIARSIQTVGSVPYYARVTADDHIPNRKFVINYVAAGVYQPGIADVNQLYVADTLIRAFDSSVSATVTATLTSANISGTTPGILTFSQSTGGVVQPGMLLSGGGVTGNTYIVSGSGLQWTLNQAATGTPTTATYTEPFSPADPTPVAETSQLIFQVDGVIQAQLNNNGFYINNIKIKTNTIKNYDLSNDLILGANNGNVQVAATLTLQNQTLPTYTSGGSKLYSNSSPGPGKSGIFFVNSTNYADELVAKNRALLLSMIF